MNAKKAIALAAVAMAATEPMAADGTWTMYPSFGSITEIEPTGKTVFALASGNVFAYNTADQTVQPYDKANALSDAGVAHIAWNSQARRLVVAYSDANIDLLAEDGTVTNLPDLYQYSGTLDKTMNNIYCSGQFAYVATGFGIVKIDVRNAVVADSYVLGFAVDHCYIEGGYIYAASPKAGTYRAKTTDNLLDKNKWTRSGAYSPLKTDRTNVKDPSANQWWTTTDTGRLTYYTVDAEGNRTYLTEGILPEGPASDNFYRLLVKNGKLYATAGIYNQDIDGTRKAEVHVLDGTQWSEFESPTQQQTGHPNIDFVCIDIDPQDSGHAFVGAKSGLYEYRGGKLVNSYNKDNSPLRSPFTGASAYRYTYVSSANFDAQGNLWVINSLVTKNIKKLSPDGKWEERDIMKSDPSYVPGNLEEAFFSKADGRLWAVNNYYGESMLFGYDTEADTAAVFGPTIVNQDGSTVGANHFYSPAEDLEGNIWIGTDVGPFYLPAASRYDSGAAFVQHKVPRNDGTNLADYLLAGIDIRAVAIDGANRKWFGTNGNGVFLISSDNNTQVQHFTAENSPLASNAILDIAIDGATGRVFFATDRGLCSYMGDATEPSQEMTKDNVWAYPNPVGPDYEGDISIVGLSYNADVKIVSSNGTLVAQGRSTGGKFVWNGRDQKGRRVASGVYMVETAAADGSKGTVCKVAVVN